MAKNKKSKNSSKKEMSVSRKKSPGAKPLVWVVLGVLLVVVIVMLVNKDGKISEETSDEFYAKYAACFSYAQASLRSEFCRYTLVNGDLINCRDQRIIDRLSSEGIDTDIGSLNCRSVDIYSYRKDVCSGHSDNTKIADTICADYR